MSLPDEYLDMTLRSVVALTGRPYKRGTPCELSIITDAVRALDARIAKEDAARAANDAEWLASKFEQLSSTLERPDK